MNKTSALYSILLIWCLVNIPPLFLTDGKSIIIFFAGAFTFLLIGISFLFDEVEEE